MQRLQTNPPAVALTDAGCPPETELPLEAEKVVPDSFAEWLAQPACTITDETELAQGIFVGVMNEVRAQTLSGPSAPSVRP
jgi:hypothetical protein